MMTNKKNRKRSNLLTKMVATLMLMVLCVTSVPIAASAATNVQLDVNNGMATVTVDSYTYQLTKALVVKQGGIDPKTGTVYLYWMSGTLYIYNHQYQNGDCKLYQIDSGVTGLKYEDPENSDKNKNILGYTTSNGEKSLLTDQQIKEKLGSNNTSNNTNNNTSNNTNNNTSNNTSNNNNISTSSKDISISGTVVIYTNPKDGKIYYTTFSNYIKQAEKMPDGKIAVYLVDNSLWKWDYESNKLEVIAGKVNSLYVAANILIGYFDQNNKLEVIQNNPTKTETEKIFKIVQDGKYLKLFENDSNIASVKFTKGKITYEGETIKNVKYCSYTMSKHKIVYMTKSGAVKLMNLETHNKKNIVQSGALEFDYENKFATKVVMKSGDIIDITKK